MSLRTDTGVLRWKDLVTAEKHRNIFYYRVSKKAGLFLVCRRDSMGRFVYGPCSFVGTLLIGLAVVAVVGYLATVPAVDRYLAGPGCVEARDAAGADELNGEPTLPSRQFGKIAGCGTLDVFAL
jgi:hypothetical protein